MQETTPERSLVTPDEREELVRLGQEISYPAGAILAQELEYSDFVLYVSEGFVKAVAARSNRTLAIHGPGSIVGELSALTGEPRSAELVTMTEVRTLYIPGRIWNQFMDEHPRSMKAHLVDLARRHRRKDLTDASVMRSERRLARKLIELAEMGLCRKKGDDLVLDRLTQQDLGSLANISRESVSATLKRLREQGAVTTSRGRITIHDMQAVRFLADREDRSG